MDHLWELREELSEHNDTVGATTDAVYTQESFVNAFNLVCHEDKMTEEEQLLRYTTLQGHQVSPFYHPHHHHLQDLRGRVPAQAAAVQQLLRDADGDGDLRHALGAGALHRRPLPPLHDLPPAERARHRGAGDLRDQEVGRDHTNAMMMMMTLLQ